MEKTKNNKEKSRILQKFLRILRLKQNADPTITINSLGFKANEMNPAYSASYYHKVMQGQRAGTREIWEILYSTLELSSLEWFLTNPSYLMRQVEIDIQKYGADKLVHAYVTEYLGSNVFYYYEHIEKPDGFKWFPCRVDVDAHAIVTCRLIDIYIFLFNQMRDLYIPFLDIQELPADVQSYIQYKWDYWNNETDN